MATCRFCGDGGIFARVDGYGLCEKCSPAIVPRIQELSASAAQHVKAASKAKKINARIDHLRQAMSACAELAPYEGKNIKALLFEPTKMAAELRAQRSAAVESFVHERWHAARDKARDAATDGGRLKGYADAIESITAIADAAEDVKPIEAAIAEMRAERDKLRFLLISKRIAKAEAKGQTKKAIDLLIDALIELRHDATPDAEQLDLIERVNAKIRELGGTPPA